MACKMGSIAPLCLSQIPSKSFRTRRRGEVFVWRRPIKEYTRSDFEEFREALMGKSAVYSSEFNTKLP